jgi:hypothetical protein
MTSADLGDLLALWRENEITYWTLDRSKKRGGVLVTFIIRLGLILRIKAIYCEIVVCSLIL